MSALTIGTPKHDLYNLRLPHPRVLCVRRDPEREAAPPAGGASGAEHGSEVLDRRKRLVEVMEEALPFLVLRRAPEANGVILELRPLDEQEIPVRPLDAAEKLE